MAPAIYTSFKHVRQEENAVLMDYLEIAFFDVVMAGLAFAVLFTIATVVMGAIRMWTAETANDVVIAESTPEKIGPREDDKNPTS